VCVQGTGKPAGLYDVANPDWLPTLRLGKEPTAAADYTAVDQLKIRCCNDHYKRAKERREKHECFEELVQALPDILII